MTAGSYNLQSSVEVRVECVGAQTRFAQIVALMESAGLQKPRLAQLADRIAKPFWWQCCWPPLLLLPGGGPKTQGTR